MLTVIKMKWIVMLFLLLYTAGSYLHCAVLYGSRTGRHHQADWNQDCL